MINAFPEIVHGKQEMHSALSPEPRQFSD